jgi:hypothetical protein
MQDDATLNDKLRLAAWNYGIRVGRRYRHYRTGGVYRVIALALGEADHEPTVVYRHVESRLTWTRTLEDFVRPMSEGVRRFEPYEPHKSGRR